MNIYFAPLEGVTDVIYRRVHNECFGGISKYYIPFICPTQHLVLTPKEYNAVSAKTNEGVPVVPQVLTKIPEHFIWAAGKLAEEGYTEVNLNLGCPSGTVTAKGKGSGMLRETDVLRSFLDGIFNGCPTKISIKTRIGYESPDEWARIAEIYAQYPISELIIHPRTRSEFYSGTPHRELMGEFPKDSNIPLVYNGDVFTAEDCRAIEQMYPNANAIMLGRGLICNPALAREYHGGAALDKASLKNFHDRLFAEYSRDWPKNAILGRMHEIMQYISCCFEDCAKPRKAIRKANTLQAYEEAAEWLFSDFPLRENPGFQPFK